MKITKRELRQMINESVREVLFEHGRGARLRDRTDDRWIDPLEAKSEKYKDELYNRNAEKMKQRITKLFVQMKDAFPNIVFELHLPGVKCNYYWVRGEWGITIRDVGVYHPLVQIFKHAKRLYLRDATGIENVWYVEGYFNQESVNELERIVNRL